MNILSNIGVPSRGRIPTAYMGVSTCILIPRFADYKRYNLQLDKFFCREIVYRAFCFLFAPVFGG